jgi:hypothetical protein
VEKIDTGITSSTVFANASMAVEWYDFARDVSAPLAVEYPSTLRKKLAIFMKNGRSNPTLLGSLRDLE